MPIVYASMGTTIYLFKYNNKIYKEYKQAYIYKTDTSASTIDIYPKQDINWLKEQEDTYHKHRDLNFLLTMLFYTLNIADAYVDAHLMSFDVSDNLSMNILPSLNFYSAKQKASPGLTLSLIF